MHYLCLIMQHIDDNANVMTMCRCRVVLRRKQAHNATHLSPVSTTRVDGPIYRPELTGDRFPLPVNTGSVDGK